MNRLIELQQIVGMNEFYKWFISSMIFEFAFSCIDVLYS